MKLIIKLKFIQYVSQTSALLCTIFCKYEIAVITSIHLRLIWLEYSLLHGLTRNMTWDAKQYYSEIGSCYIKHIYLR